jgi:hypothetical protein
MQAREVEPQVPAPQQELPGNNPQAAPQAQRGRFRTAEVPEPVAQGPQELLVLLGLQAMPVLLGLQAMPVLLGLQAMPERRGPQAPPAPRLPARPIAET